MGMLRTITLASGRECNIYDRPVLLGDTPVITVIKVSDTERRVAVIDNAYNEIGHNDLIIKDSIKDELDGLDLIIYLKTMLYHDAKIWIESGDPITGSYFDSLNHASFKNDIVKAYESFEIR